MTGVTLTTMEPTRKRIRTWGACRSCFEQSACAAVPGLDFVLIPSLKNISQRAVSLRVCASHIPGSYRNIKAL